MRIIARWIATAGLAGLVPAAAAAQTVDTRNGTRLFGGTTVSFGQTFTVPAGAASLTSFSFFLTEGGESTSAYRAIVRPWSAGGEVGAPIYQSAVRGTSSCCTITQEIFETGGIAVTPGAQYLAYLEQLGGRLTHTLPDDGTGAFANTYAGGEAALAWCFPDPFTCTWVPEEFDRDFVATFAPASVVPEPSTYALLATGLAGVLGARRLGRRRP